MTNKTKDEKPAVNLNTNQVPPKRINRFGLLFREKWPEYIIEIIVIILSITVSFALNEWKENNSKYELEQVYLKSLYHDINSDIEALHEVIEETELVIHKGHVLLDLSKQSNWSELNYGQFITDLQDVFKRPNFIAKEATFTELKSSGHTQILSDFTLKTNLFEYYKHYESVNLIEEAEREAMIYVIAPYLLKHFPMAGTTLSGDESHVQSNIMAALKDVEYQNSIFVRIANREELLDEYKDMLKASRIIKERLQKQIK